MSGGPPKLIIMDQDAAMTKVIVIGLPKKFHRYCTWYIVKKFVDKANLKDNFCELHQCIWEVNTREEFYAKWDDVVTTNGRKEDMWLSSIYALCTNCILACNKHVFSARMSSIQRAKGSLSS